MLKLNSTFFVNMKQAPSTNIPRHRSLTLPIVPNLAVTRRI